MDNKGIDKKGLQSERRGSKKRAYMTFMSDINVIAIETQPSPFKETSVYISLCTAVDVRVLKGDICVVLNRVRSS